MSDIDYNTPGNTAIDELLTEIYILSKIKVR